jgi:outer membrane protein OmpA-like peptidoglycan-associated protein
MANGDATSVRNAIAGRDGWQAFVSAPTVESDLSTQLSALQADVAARDTSIALVSTERDTLATSVAALEVERDTAVTDLEALRASLDDTQSDSASLQGELDGAQAALESASGELAERDATIVGLNGLVSDLTANSAALTNELEAQKASLNSDQQAGAALRAQIAEQAADIDAVSGDLAARDAVIAGLDDKVLKASEAQTVAQDRIAALTDTLVSRDGEVADLTAQLAGQSQDAAKLVDLSSQIETLEGTNKGLTSEVAAFGAVIASKEATIVDLRKKVATPATVHVPAGTAEFAAQCSVRAGEVLETAQINFSSGTANIQNNSIDVLERLTGIALACADSGLGVEVGGHTDSQGSDEANQSLSERRATAIADFMFDRGVPANALSPVGYGEAQPIGDNATPEGRAQNRRISFEWQTR